MHCYVLENDGGPSAKGATIYDVRTVCGYQKIRIKGRLVWRLRENREVACKSGREGGDQKSQFIVDVICNQVGIRATRGTAVSSLHKTA